MIRINWTLAAALCVFGSAQATSKPAANPPPAPAARGPALDVSIEAAQEALRVCSAKGFNVSVSIVDSAGVLKVLLAADGAHSRGVHSSTNKAVTALTFNNSTSALDALAKNDATLSEKIAANPNFNTRAGGVLLQVGSEVVGAIGVGGARGSENDEACALAGIEKIKNRLK